MLSLPFRAHPSPLLPSLLPLLVLSLSGIIELPYSEVCRAFVSILQHSETSSRRSFVFVVLFHLEFVPSLPSSFLPRPPSFGSLPLLLVYADPSPLLPLLRRRCVLVTFYCPTSSQSRTSSSCTLRSETTFSCRPSRQARTRKRRQKTEARAYRSALSLSTHLRSKI